MTLAIRCGQDGCLVKGWPSSHSESQSVPVLVLDAERAATVLEAGIRVEAETLSDAGKVEVDWTTVDEGREVETACDDDLGVEEIWCDDQR